MRPRMRLLAALLLTLTLAACSTPTAQQPSGPRTTITVAAGDATGAVDTLGVPFDGDGNPYVDTIHIAVYHHDIRVRFDLEDGVYSSTPTATKARSPSPSTQAPPSSSPPAPRTSSAPPAMNSTPASPTASPPSPSTSTRTTSNSSSKP